MACARSTGSLITILAMLGQAREPPARADEGEAQRLVEGAVARSTVVFSGRLQYRMKLGFRDKNSVSEDNEYRVSFSGTSWSKRRLSGHQFVAVNHDGKWMRFSQSKQPNGSMARGLQIAAPKAINATDPAPPYFAGTFWYEVTAKFIEAHLNDARDKGEEEVNGVRARVLEWQVAKPFDAFDAIGESLQSGGSLRVYIAPQLGFALPRYEYVAPNGAVATRFDASDFKEAAPGVYFPRSCSTQHFNPSPTFYQEYHISRVEKVNSEIPEEDFRIEIPVGTEIRDGRGKYGIYFQAGRSPPPGLEEDVAKLLIFEEESGSAWLRFWRSPTVAVVSGIGLGLLLVVLYAWLRRRRRGAAAS